jgi:guanylate kinase
MMVEPRLVSYSGVVASGKTFLLDKLQPQLNEKIFTRSVSSTTRSVRNGEEPNKDYFFTDKPTFEAQIEQDAFLEYNHNQTNDAYYGTTKAAVLEPLKQGKTVLRNSDYTGAETAKKVLGKQAVNIFILPEPFLNINKQMETLEQRLDRRSPDMPEEEKQARLAQARKEIERFYTDAGPFDYLLLNAHGGLAMTLAKLKEISYKGEAKAATQKHVYPYEASPIVNAFNHVKQLWWDLTHAIPTAPAS